MQKISSYLYPNRIELLADLATFTVEYTNVYQRTVKIYKGIDNTIEFDIKNADQKRIDLTTLSSIQLNVMDAMGNALPNSPYAVSATSVKGIATVVIPQADIDSLDDQFLRYSVTAVKDLADVMLYADSRFGAVSTIELVGSAMPITRPNRVFKSFTAEIDLNGVPTNHSSAIPAKFYEAVPTSILSFDVDVRGFVGSVWLEATKATTISVESFKHSDYLRSFTSTITAPATTIVSFADIPVGEYQYFRISYSTPTANGVGSSYTVTKENGTYTVTIRAGGTGYAVGSQMKVLGSVLGGVDGINDLIISVTAIDGASQGNVSSYALSSVSSISFAGTASAGTGTYIVTGTNITGTVDKVTVS